MSAMPVPLSYQGLPRESKSPVNEWFRNFLKGCDRAPLYLYHFYVRHGNYTDASFFLVSAVDRGNLEACNIAQDLDPCILDDKMDLEVRFLVTIHSLVAERLRYVLVVTSEEANDRLAHDYTWSELANECLRTESWTMDVRVNSKRVGHAFVRAADKDEEWPTFYPRGAVTVFRVQDLKPRVEYNPAAQECVVRSYRSYKPDNYVSGDSNTYVARIDRLSRD